MNPRAARLAASLVSMILAVGLGGCSARSSESYETPDPSVKVTDPGWGQSGSASPSPSPSISSFPPAPEGESEEKAAIRKAWETYQIVKNQYYKDPSLKDFTELAKLTTGEESSSVISRITQDRDLNLRLEGDAVRRAVTVGDPETNANGVRVAIVTSCFDPSKQFTVDITTGERSEKTLKETLWETVTMEQGLDGIYRAAIYRNKKESC